MFFRKELTHTISLHPSFFGPSLHAHLEARLYQEKEGTCTGRDGYVISVLKIEEVQKGRVKIGDGGAEFTIKFNAIVYKPFKGEVVDALVFQVNKLGFQARAGPTEVFVTSHLIPPDLKFDPNSNPPCYSSEEDTQTIAVNTKVRLKIVGVRIDATEITEQFGQIGTIKEDFLGPID
ncbi:hypothetical protein BT69DRAFT_1214975 [Atractiella rhizophila]|nr:hypothetical protein BT69DRAFT_1214975 [Atractiella rhizophila]